MIGTCELQAREGGGEANKGEHMGEGVGAPGAGRRRTSFCCCGLFFSGLIVICQEHAFNSSGMVRHENTHALKSNKAAQSG